MPNRTKKISNDIAIRIKTLRLKNGLTQKELSKKLFKSESAVRMWELGKSEPDIETLNKLSNIFGVTIDCLLGNTSSIFLLADPSPENKIGLDALIGSRLAESPALPKGVKIPVYGKVAAGIPIEAITDIEDYEEITEEMARKGDYAALTIHGDSMEPKISEGDVVIVRLQDTIETGEIAIVMVNGDEATCKKIKKTPEGIMLISTNPAYEPMFYSNQEIENLPIRIFGKVVELRAKFI